jgi:hypothetical protein
LLSPEVLAELIQLNQPFANEEIHMAMDNLNLDLMAIHTNEEMIEINQATNRVNIFVECAKLEDIISKTMINQIRSEALSRSGYVYCIYLARF